MDKSESFCLSIADPALSVDVAIFGRSQIGAGWALSDRQVDEHYLAAWITGEAACVVDGQEVVMGPGSAWWIAPGVMHSARPRDPSRGFRFHHLRFACPAPVAHRALILPAAGSLEPRFTSLREAWRADDPLATASFRLQLGALCAEMLRLPQEPVNGLEAGLRRQLVAWVTSRLPRPIHPRELAAQAGMELDWFTRRFRASFGLPPRSWLLHERVRWAADLLADGALPVATAAARAGFANPALFSRQFRQVLGTSPRAWAAGLRQR